MSGLSFLGGPDPVLLAAGALPLLLALTLLIAYPAGPSRKLRQRIDRTRLGAMGGRPNRPESRAPTSVRRRSASTLLGGAGRALSQSLPRSDALRRRLDLAGLSLNVLDYVVLCLAAGVVAAGAARLVAGAPWAIAAAIGVTAATGLPHVLLATLVRRKKRSFLSQFPDAIDLIVRGVKSGLPVAEALQAAGQELTSHVGATFQEVTGNIKLGRTLDESLAMAARNVGVQEFKFFMISLTIQQETGGNLGEILSNLSVLMRRREQVKLKIKAMSSEARASAMIIGALPFIMFGVIYVIDPDYVMKLFVDPRGWLLLAGGGCSLTLGLGIMSKMVRFEI